jgi:glycosyltransferase involved in cell wall biosynthesis
LVHANWSATGVIAGLAATLWRKPVITTLRGSDIALAESRAPFRWTLRLCLQLNHALVTVGEDLRERSARLLGIDPARIAVIPNGVAREFFALPVPRLASILRLLAVGALVPVKGLDILLDALARLPTQSPVELTLVGEGPERSRLEAQISAMGLTGRVRLIGAAAPSEIPQLMRVHHVFVLPSRAEGRPNALIEAMAAARAVVAAAIPGVTEVAVDGRNALLFPPNDSEALTARLRTLIETPAMIPQLGAQARAAVADLDWTVTARRYADLYRATLVEHRP